jgi:DNA-binding transcriptional regulator YdaS (Cro superfamily)
MKNTKCTELSATQYLPEVLFERLCARLGARSYSALGRAIGLSPSVVSKVRNRRLAISSEILLKIHDATDIPVRELRRWMGDTRPYYSPLSPAIVRPPIKGETTIIHRSVRSESR